MASARKLESMLSSDRVVQRDTVLGASCSVHRAWCIVQGASCLVHAYVAHCTQHRHAAPARSTMHLAHCTTAFLTSTGREHGSSEQAGFLVQNHLDWHR
jgi:hypothetical protein